METIPSAYYFGEFTLDVGKGCVLKGQEEIKLRPKVFEALQYFVQNSGRLIGKQELIQAIWPDSFVTDDRLLEIIVAMFQRGEFNRIRLANKAIAEFEAETFIA